MALYPPSATELLVYQSRPPCPRLKIYAELSVFLLGFLCLIIPSGYSYGATLLFVGGLYTLFTHRRVLPLDRYDKLILGAVLLFGVQGLVSWLIHGFDGDVDKLSRFILAIPVFFLIYRARPSLHALWLGLAFGVLGALLLALYQRLILGELRADGFSNAIQFGNLAMLMGMLCLAGLAWAHSLSRHRRKMLVLLSLAAVAGVITSALSGSRGGWLGLPIILVVIFVAYYAIFSLRAKLLVLLCVVLGGFFLLSNPHIGVKQRIAEAYHEIALFQDGTVQTSVGYRLEMWRGAIKLAQEKPLFGWGDEGYQEGMQQLRETNQIRGRADLFTHAHNEFIDRLAKQGITGLIALILLYQVPLWTFASAKRAAHLPTRAVAMAGILLSLCYFDFGLTQAFLRHNNGVMVYVCYMMVIAAYFKVMRFEQAKISSE
ncbi:O-antigen ligase family protein [Oligella urethralis]|uniref:O-antigen ligase n=1 Tax=Oligella urethralis TaxID=90245 RepID=A0A2X1UKJ3_9BURK|nr:O-antigen ligase [Oligella urethralis]SPY07699.1 O-antigen ligase [Oligella urethralis]